MYGKQQLKPGDHGHAAEEFWNNGITSVTESDGVFLAHIASKQFVENS